MDSQARSRVTPPTGEDLLQFARWTYRKVWKGISWEHYDEDDMVQEGLVYLLAHFDKWDASRGAWTTFAQWYLRSAWTKLKIMRSKKLPLEGSWSSEHEIEKSYSVLPKDWARTRYFGLKSLPATEPPEPFPFTWEQLLEANTLTDYQRKVATMVSKGHRQAQIGKLLGCTPQAAGQTWRNAYAKLKVRATELSC